MPQIEIRPARPDDAPHVAAVLVAAGVAAWSDFLGAERIRAATENRTHPADLVAAEDRQLVGFVAWDESTGEITRLYTHPRVWGRGVGRTLLDHALDALRSAGCAHAWLNTEERNERAVRFYERHGWRIEGEPRVRDWHGARLREPRFVRDL